MRNLVLLEYRLAGIARALLRINGTSAKYCEYCSLYGVSTSVIIPECSRSFRALQTWPRRPLGEDQLRRASLPA